MKILTLPVNRVAFDMLADPNPGTRKNQEYRAIGMFWGKRMLKERCQQIDFDEWPNVIEQIKNGLPDDASCFFDTHELSPVKFDLVKFTNGYGNKVPFVIREWTGLSIGKPNPLWVPPGFMALDDDYFRIELGEIVTL